MIYLLVCYCAMMWCMNLVDGGRTVRWCPSRHIVAITMSCGGGSSGSGGGSDVLSRGHFTDMWGDGRIACSSSSASSSASSWLFIQGSPGTIWVKDGLRGLCFVFVLSRRYRFSQWHRIISMNICISTHIYHRTVKKKWNWTIEDNKKRETKPQAELLLFAPIIPNTL